MDFTPENGYNKQIQRGEPGCRISFTNKDEMRQRIHALTGDIDAMLQIIYEERGLTLREMTCRYAREIVWNLPGLL